MSPLDQVYQLLLNPATTDFERQLLQTAKHQAEADDRHAWSTLEAGLRPLASRENLTPDVADFYATLRHLPVSYFNFAKHDEALTRYPNAIFAGGCFWCLVQPFETLPGIISVESGYIGGTQPHPTYAQVHGTDTGYVEAVQVVYDPDVISYTQLLDLYWQLSDPTDALGQINDRGPAYRPIIFTNSPEQMKIAQASKQALRDSRLYHEPIVTEIRLATQFWPAENYHQQFYLKHPKRYARIHRTRQQFLWIKRFAGRMHKWFA
ncbi:peptide-methionine (S)-S-oxide reductase MsrA [Lacticaseibacillus porcinae]|uniref:peptide-methionine (S)-S-oxide reductase MsrA n=1 Tax=Lacticaseibacillus porcinae TaxID=1123687 RepID=UPI000F7B4E24|nr:peptide-methionine (S)-S-oxide reductase MsrA [Lacticaseibacillus porcinae]